MDTTVAPEVIHALTNISLHCVECSASYPAVKIGTPARYRWDCGGGLDVFDPALAGCHPEPSEGSVPIESDFLPLTGVPLRQLFDERSTTPPIWPISPNDLLLERSGVWRYRELILPIPEEYIVSRPEGNTGVYPGGTENCGTGRAGHQQIGLYAGLERVVVKHEERQKQKNS